MNSPWRRPDCCVASCWCNLKAGSVPKALICLQSHSRPRYTTGSTRRLCISSTSNALRSRREQVISTARSNSCVAPLNSNPLWGSAAPPPPLLWKRCCGGVCKPMWTRRLRRSNDWPPYPPNPDLCCSTSRCCGYGRYSPGLAVTRSRIASSPNDIARWQRHSASKDTWRWLGPCKTRIHSPPTGYVKPVAAAPPDDRGSG